MQPREWLDQLSLAVAQQDQEGIKQAVKGFRLALPTQLSIDQLAQRLQVDYRTARGWEERGIAPKPAVLDRFSALLPIKPGSEPNAKQTLLEDLLGLEGSYGLVPLEAILKQSDLKRVTMCTAERLPENIGEWRYPVLAALQAGTTFRYLFPTGTEAEKSFHQFQRFLPAEVAGHVSGIPITSCGLCSLGIRLILCDGGKEASGMDEWQRGYLYAAIPLMCYAQVSRKGIYCFQMTQDHHLQVRTAVAEALEELGVVRV